MRVAAPLARPRGGSRRAPPSWSSLAPQTRHLPPGLYWFLPRPPHPPPASPGVASLSPPWLDIPPPRRHFLSQCAASQPLTDASRAPAQSVCLFCVSPSPQCQGLEGRDGLQVLMAASPKPPTCLARPDTCQVKARASSLEPKKEAEIPGANFEIEKGGGGEERR